MRLLSALPLPFLWLSPAVMLGIGSAAQAQERPDFSGVWRLDPEESSLGPLGDREIIWIIDHQDPSIHVVVDVRDPDGSEEFSFQCTTDGRECANELTQIDEVRTMTAVWQDAVLVMNQTSTSPRGEFEAVDRLRASHSGKRLVFERTLRDERGERDIVEVFQRLGPHPSQRPAVPDPQPSVDLPPELDRVLRDYERHWRSGDEEALAGLFVRDGLVTRRGAWIRGRTAIREQYEGSSSALRLRAVEWAAGDDLGYIIGAFGYGEALPVEDSGTFVLTLRRGADGRWLIVSDLDTAISQ